MSVRISFQVPFKAYAGYSALAMYTRLAICLITVFPHLNEGGGFGVRPTCCSSKSGVGRRPPTTPQLCLDMNRDLAYRT